MKKIMQICSVGLLALGCVACNSSTKADTTAVCIMQTSIDDIQFNSTYTMEYNKEKEIVLSLKGDETYSNLDNEPFSVNIRKDVGMKASELTSIEGLEALVRDETDAEYFKLEIDGEALDVEDMVSKYPAYKAWIKDGNINIEMITNALVSEGYSCDLDNK